MAFKPGDLPRAVVNRSYCLRTTFLLIVSSIRVSQLHLDPLYAVVHGLFGVAQDGLFTSQEDSMISNVLAPFSLSFRFSSSDNSSQLSLDLDWPVSSVSATLEAVRRGVFQSSHPPSRCLYGFGHSELFSSTFRMAAAAVRPGNLVQAACSR